MCNNSRLKKIYFCKAHLEYSLVDFWTCYSESKNKDLVNGNNWKINKDQTTVTDWLLKLLIRNFFSTEIRRKLNVLADTVDCTIISVSKDVLCISIIFNVIQHSIKY